MDEELYLLTNAQMDAIFDVPRQLATVVEVIVSEAKGHNRYSIR